MPAVEYVLNLKDYLSDKIKSASNETERLTEKMGSLTERVKHIGEAFGVSFAMFKGIEFINASMEAYEQVEFAQSQLEAGLESTKYAAGLTFDELKQGAIDAAHQFKFTEGSIMEMQSILLTFPAVTKQTFGEASSVILDMSTRLGTDLKSTAIQVGKALQDPEKGIMALRRVGVNFNEAQTEMIKKMVEGGKAAQAQMYIMNELKNEFGGSAAAAANADVMFRFNKSMEEMKVTIGEVADKLMEKVAPALEWFMDTIKGIYHWVVDNAKAIKEFAIVVGALVAPFVAITAASYAWAVASGVLSTVLGAVAAVMDIIVANPIVAAIGAIAAIVTWAYLKFAAFRGVIWAVWSVIKETVSIEIDLFKALWHVIHGAFTLNPKEIAKGFSDGVQTVKDAAFRIGKAAKDGYKAGVADFEAGQKETVDKPKDLTKHKPLPAQAQGPTNPETKKAQGNKAVTINIKIDSLVKDFKINTTNIQEGAAKVQEMITNVMLAAVNNAQIVAGQ